jgi:hypothetical protein
VGEAEAEEVTVVQVVQVILHQLHQVREIMVLLVRVTAEVVAVVQVVLAVVLPAAQDHHPVLLVPQLQEQAVGEALLPEQVEQAEEEIQVHQEWQELPTQDRVAVAVVLAAAPLI